MNSVCVMSQDHRFRLSRINSKTNYKRRTLDIFGN